MSRQPLRLAIMEAERILAEAGVASPRTDAELIAAHVLGAERGKLMLTPLVDRQVIEAIGQLVHQRAKRIPLQHLLGWAVMGAVTLQVGPGVFVPRPETELLLEWGLEFLAGREHPVVVDLCTGTGALALAVAAERPDAEVHAVEIDPTALAWARRNMESSRVRLHSGDVTAPDLFAELDARVDLVLCNPPYVPVGTAVPPEVGEHDPFKAVFSGSDGLTVIRHVVNLSARLLKPGGAVVIEHDDTHAESVPELLATRKVLTDVEDHDDLAGRPRFATAIRTS
ncbi:peptide chain release factor N(5)-glutamine methyltransferase [Actinophytocola algeriensis]|uniref:Release factor glutamine methyltransferase n=1 Tax=Actinophytocola algeriensis TaxID=1768010 RepID=A0A7W7VF72_9PSEU|nr:peptide chain release factor N(5)-glutamine methyltransferase [Actinophytocola algeriensis]MBB4908007.1 release factor glutamine methyltransferase [Actinophytocola algeriensis]MBE1480037.1 release factor glutamine methyltransferase [Actinophytocola algeriensis]